VLVRSSTEVYIPHFGKIADLAKGFNNNLLVRVSRNNTLTPKTAP
jgi:hypothetical protein